MTLFKPTITAAALVLLSGCPQPQPPPNPDASDAASYAAAVCANLRQNQCEEGLDPKCEATINHDLASPITTMPLSCWASASGKPALRACGDSRSGHLACP